MENKELEKKVKNITDRMTNIYKKGAPHMLPTTFGHAVVELLQNDIPVTNQSLKDSLVKMKESVPGSPIEVFYQEALNLLDRHTI